MSLEWKSCKIGDLGKIFSGGTPSTKIKEYWDGDLNWLSSGETRNTYIYTTDKFITEEGANNSSTKLANKGDIVIASAGQGFTRGQSSMVMIDTYVNQSVIVISPNDKVNNHYLLYNLKFRYPELRQLSDHASTRGSLTTKIIKGLDINLPDLNTQNKIATIIQYFDKKIETNKRINKNLFNIIDFIFKDYVGDYEDLEIVSLSENTQEIIRGFNSKYVEKSNIKNFNQKVNKGTFLEKQHFKYLDENIEIPKAKFAKKRDVLVNSLGDGTVGRPHYYNEDTDNVVVDQHITIIRANEDLIPSTYIYEYLKNSTGQYHLDSLISGSTGMLMLNISEIRNLKIPILDKKNLREFDTTVTPLFDKITKNFEEIYCLSKLRDTLLPKLMSGEINVSEVNCDLKIIIRKIYIKSSKLFLWRYLSENQNHIKNTKSNETLLKSRAIHKINKFLAKFNARYRYYRQ
ncbi:restriction endonuclease subunit S [Methanobrevibacter smithii]|uniref:restriction endonuclease subunit S n=1 Tax=Methanobrevibacter smithii TaxID=2173 RepID=UPI0037DD2D82